MQLESDAGAAIRQPLRFLRAADGSGLLWARDSPSPESAGGLAPSSQFQGPDREPDVCAGCPARGSLLPDHSQRRVAALPSRPFLWGRRFVHGQLPPLMFPAWLCHPLQRPAQCHPAGQEAPRPLVLSKGLLEAPPPQASRGRPRHVTQGWGGGREQPRSVSSGLF